MSNAKVITQPKHKQNERTSCLRACAFLYLLAAESEIDCGFKFVVDDFESIENDRVEAVDGNLEFVGGVDCVDGDTDSVELTAIKVGNIERRLHCVCIALRCLQIVAYIETFRKISTVIVVKNTKINEPANLTFSFVITEIMLSTK